ncbi:MAG TPA: MBL fold metallo-hydrolase, partial [Gemmatimonadales bacterium]|nr:MBL fold metallo-hydrolase [Gemmatimonadales bacterium]
MTLVHSFTVGKLRCHTLEGGLQRLDGGAMFGVVPKPLWERQIAPDERNRIPLAMRCLLVEHDDGLVLIDNAVGTKEDQRFRDIYGIENAGREAPSQLEDALRQLGHGPDDITWVINTHL